VSNTTTSGAIVVNGGAGIRGNLHVGGNITLVDGVNQSIIDMSRATLEIKNPTVSTTRIELSAPSVSMTGQLARASQSVALTTQYVYSPTNIPGLRLWFDANDAASVQITGGYVSQWNDKSGFNAHATPTSTTTNTYGSTLYNGLPGIQFNAVGFSAPLAPGTLSNGCTIFFVFQKNGSAQAFEGLCSRSLNNTYPSPFDIYNAVRLLGNGTTYNNQTSSFDIRNGTGLNIFTGAITIQNIYGTQAIYNEWVNGTSQMTNPTAFNYGDTANGFYIGTRAEGGTNFRGVMSEVIVYNRVLNNTEREVIEGYLASKWNMRSNLVAYHPYKNNSPTYNPVSLTNTLRNPVLSNSKLHAYMYTNENLSIPPKTVVAQSYSLIMPATPLGLGGGNILFNCIGKLQAGTIVNGCFFYISGTSTNNCHFGIYNGGSSPTLLAQTSPTASLVNGMNYIEFTSTWIVPSTGTYYLGLLVASAVNILYLPSSNRYSHGYTTVSAGVLNRMCVYTTSTYTTLPATLSGIGIAYSNYNAWVGLYANNVPPLQSSVSPNNLAIADLTTNSIRITYTANPSATSYIIRTSPATGTITTTSTDITITGASNTDTVQYTVYVYGVNSTGYVSSPSTIMTLIPPATVSVASVVETSANIVFTHVAGATYYQIESIPSNGTQTVYASPASLNLQFDTSYSGIRMRSAQNTTYSLWKTFTTSYSTLGDAYYKFESGDITGSTILNYAKSTYDATRKAPSILPTINTTTYKKGTGSLQLVKTNGQYVSLPTTTNTSTGFSIATWINAGTDASNDCIAEYSVPYPVSTSSLQFNADTTYNAINASYSTSSTPVITIEWWVKVNGGNPNSGILSINGINIDMYYSTGLRWSPGPTYAGFPTSGWTHIAFVYRPNVTNGILVYANGILVATKSYTATGYSPTGSNFTLGIGRNGGYIVNNFRIWNYERTPQQNMDAYKGRYLSNQGLVCHLPLNEGTGTIVNNLAPGQTSTFTITTGAAVAWTTDVPYTKASVYNVATMCLSGGFPLVRAGGNSYTAPVSVANSTWNHLAWSIDSAGAWNAYVNGTEYNTSIIEPLTITSRTENSIGRYGGNVLINTTSNMYIDDYRQYPGKISYSFVQNLQ